MNALKTNSGTEFINIIGNYMWCHFNEAPTEWTLSRQRVEIYKN